MAVCKGSFTMFFATTGVVILILMTFASAWVLPGSYPKDHGLDDIIKVKVNSLSSIFTQVPYGYYYAPYPKPDKIINDAENLGEILTGDKSENSLYEVRMLRPENCRPVSNLSVLLKEDNYERFEYLINRSYFINLSCEDLPATTVVDVEGPAASIHVLGAAMGFIRKDQYYLNNHISFVFYYHQPKFDVQKYRIVGFEMYATSKEHTRQADGSLSCVATEPSLLKENKEIYFTYDVTWKASVKRWVSRWDTYIQSYDAPIHWFSIVNALVIVLFLGIMIAMILLRTLLKDIARYNDFENMEDAHEEWGWKLLHGDVFRKPAHYSLLSMCVGTGVQILGITLVTAALASIGIFSPAFRGSLLQSSLIFFGFMGFPAGYTAAACYKIFDKTPLGNMRVPLLTGFLFPGVCLAVFTLLNFLLWINQSSGAIPFGSFFVLVFLWLCISLPCVFAGYVLGYKYSQIDPPVLTNKIPRAIPPQHWLMHPISGCLIGGILPFGAVFTELLFIMSSLWLRRFYFLFGFLLSVVIILIIACAEISIALTYFRLVAEDYRWWWPSFFYSAFSGVYILMYCLFYYFRRLPLIGFVPVALFFGYMFLLSYGFFLLTGACGFIATFYFLRAIYGSVKFD